MKIFKILKTILKNYECQCYIVDEKNSKLIFKDDKNMCSTLNPAIADVTGFLLSEGIDYDMDENNNIILKLTPNIQIKPQIKVISPTLA